jgi:hypothetical protein
MMGQEEKYKWLSDICDDVFSSWTYDQERDK